MTSPKRIVASAVATAALAGAALAVVPTASASAATGALSFAGTISSTMNVNNGTTVGSIPAGTPYTGSLTWDSAQAPTPVAYNGGTHTVYSFTNLAFTIGSSTANSGPGSIDVFDNLTSTVGYPSGDSVYVNFTQGVPNSTGVAPSGLLSGLGFNWMGLALLDPTGHAITSGALPALDSTAFTTKFSEFNFGAWGTPWGAGNTSMIQSLTSINGSGGTPPPTAVAFSPTLPDGTVGAAYTSTFAAATGGTGSFTYSASGLPSGLSLAGTTVSGTPDLAGTYNVTLTATDSAGATASATVPVTIADPATPVVCAGTNAVETAYVARNPGYVVINGGLNLLDHLWTTNLNASNTTFLGGLVNWYQTGLILSYTGIADPAGCILDHLTVAPQVSIGTTSLPNGTTSMSYSAPINVAWGVAPYTLNVTGLPSGLSFNGSSIVGTPTTAGTFTVNVTATDSVNGTASASLPLTIASGGNYTVKDESQGKITAIDPNYTWVMVGTKKLIWNTATLLKVNTPNGVRTVVDSFVKVGMRAQWKGLRDKATNTVLTSQLEIN